MSETNPTQIYGLIGYPVKHSFSPAMHNAAFRHLNINAEYRLFEVKPEELGGFFSTLSQKGIYGLNVTVPHKEKVLDFVSLDDSESYYLKKIRAVNTVVRKGNQLQGFNTDIHGFQWHLIEKNNVNPSNKKVALLGAGGAARAVTYVLAKFGAKEIAIFDIDNNKSKNVTNMIKSLPSSVKIFPVDSIEQLDIKNKDFLVNATPVGLKETDPCLIKEEMLHKDLFVYDLIYNPPETKLLTLAKKMGARTSNGSGMLIYQAALAFEHFTEASQRNIKGGSIHKVFEIMKQALQEELKRCRK